MDKRRSRRVCRILYAVGIAVKVLAIYAVVFSGLAFVNGGRYGMALPFGIGLAVWVLADEMVEAVERRKK